MKRILLLIITVITFTTLIAQNHPIAVDDYVDGGTDASLDITGNITIEAWIYSTRTNQHYWRRIVEKDWDSDSGEVIGIVTMIYDHHTSDTVTKLLELQHSIHIGMYSTMHVHLDHDNCLEILALKGSPVIIKEFADKIKSVRGVKHTGLVMTSNVK